MALLTANRTCITQFRFSPLASIMKSLVGISRRTCTSMVNKETKCIQFESKLPLLLFLDETLGVRLIPNALPGVEHVLAYLGDATCKPASSTTTHNVILVLGFFVLFPIKDNRADRFIPDFSAAHTNVSRIVMCNG